MQVATVTKFTNDKNKIQKEKRFDHMTEVFIKNKTKITSRVSAVKSGIVNFA